MPCHDIIQERGGGSGWGGGSTAGRSRSSRASCPCLSPCWRFSWRCRAGCRKVQGLRSCKRRRGDHSRMLGSCCSHTASCPTNIIVKHQWTLVRSALSPPCLSPCDCRMSCRRHRLRQGRSSQRPEPRSCRMLAGSSKYARYYQAGEGTDIPGQALRNCPLDWCSRLGGHSGSTNTRSAVWSEQSEMFKTSQWSFWSIGATSSK